MTGEVISLNGLLRSFTFMLGLFEFVIRFWTYGFKVKYETSVTMVGFTLIALYDPSLCWDCLSLSVDSEYVG